MNPCYSGFQVQGAATAPTGMTPPDTRNFAVAPTTHYIITEYRKKCNTFLKFYHSLAIYALNYKSARQIHDLTGDKRRIISRKKECRICNVLGHTDSHKWGIVYKLGARFC